ncbi:hypothetical protein B4U79_00135 [Dinothrombium tinctorium]|uniref:Uncharacterized protein n=1 Tax=Dinothrombium tinctorium TaxID=1965070 RepID=A0A3S3PZB8_9ACAR|nr:hypothetical protein B4U79_15231 [Dinothrombium tinctorium]RWS11523.1 hypothetical protein B4U79_00135 [Dinothrombium tinctorium]
MSTRWHFRGVLHECLLQRTRMDYRLLSRVKRLSHELKQLKNFFRSKICFE